MFTARRLAAGERNWFTKINALRRLFVRRHPIVRRREIDAEARHPRRLVRPVGEYPADRLRMLAGVGDRFRGPFRLADRAGRTRGAGLVLAIRAGRLELIAGDGGILREYRAHRLAVGRMVVAAVEDPADIAADLLSDHALDVLVLQQIPDRAGNLAALQPRGIVADVADLRGFTRFVHARRVIGVRAQARLDQHLGADPGFGCLALLAAAVAVVEVLDLGGELGRFVFRGFGRGFSGRFVGGGVVGRFFFFILAAAGRDAEQDRGDHAVIENAPSHDIAPFDEDPAAGLIT